MGRWVATVGVAVSVALAPAAAAQTHNYINMMRSSTESHLFVQQSLDGEYGKYTTEGDVATEGGGHKTFSQTNFWKGYGIGTSIGLEVLKFVQMVAGHTFVNLRYKDDALESLNGSRLTAALRLVFLAPIGNLEAGSGITGARLDYQKQLDNASFYGNGVYYSLGLNYFVNGRVSFYYEAKTQREHLVRNGGNASVDTIDTDATLMGVGFRIWL